MNTPSQNTRPTDLTALTCDSCGITFNLIETGGKIERTQGNTAGYLLNLETFCTACNTANTEYRMLTQAAELLLSGTGITLGELTRA